MLHGDCLICLCSCCFLSYFSSILALTPGVQELGGGDGAGAGGGRQGLLRPDRQRGHAGRRLSEPRGRQDKEENENKEEYTDVKQRQQPLGQGDKVEEKVV